MLVEQALQPPNRSQLTVVGGDDPADRRLKPRACAPPQARVELARWLLIREMGSSQEPLEVPDAAERAFQKLLDRLARLITPSGCHAILSRALHLAQADFRFLWLIEPGPTAGIYIEGLSKSADGTDQEVVRRGILSLLATLIDLVALFIGDVLTDRLLREIWPDLPVHGPTQPARTVN